MKTTIRNVICIIACTTLPAICQFASMHAQEFVKSDFMVSDLTGLGYRAPQLSVSKKGDMVVVWETTGSGGGIWFKTISSLGTQLSEQKLVKSTVYHHATRVAHTDSGNFMIMSGEDVSHWRVYGQIYDRNGNEIGDTMKISRNTSEKINMYFASLFADRNNQFGAFVPGFDSMMVEKISGTGEFVGNTIVLKPGMDNVQKLTGVMTRSGNYIMIWIDIIGGNIHGLRYTPEGIPIGEIFQVSQKEDSSYIQSIALGRDTSGNFAVGWSTNKESITYMYSQLFNAEGVSVGSNTRISDEQSNFIHASGKMSISMDVDGKFVIAWPDNRGNDTTFIYLQQMDNQGERVGGNYRATSINNNTQPVISLPAQVHPCVHILRDTIYLAWANYNQDVSTRVNIFANIQKWMPDVTGIDQQVLIPVETKVYPNPSAGIFTLNIEHDYSGQLELEVYNASGVLVKQEIRSWSGQEETIDLSTTPEGMYYLNIKGDSFKSTTPLIIIK